MTVRLQIVPGQVPNDQNSLKYLRIRGVTHQNLLSHNHSPRKGNTMAIIGLHLVPAEEAAPQLSRHPVTLRRNLRDGTVPGVKIGGRWYISSAVLDRLLAGEPVEAPAPGETGGAA
jgi:hypothetical protein